MNADDINFPKDATTMAGYILDERTVLTADELLRHLAERLAGGEAEAPFLYDHLVISAWLKAGGSLINLVCTARKIRNEPGVVDYLQLLNREFVSKGPTTDSKSLISPITEAVEMWLKNRQASV